MQEHAIALLDSAPQILPLFRIIASFCFSRCCSQPHHQSSPYIAPSISHPYHTLTVTVILAKTRQTGKSPVQNSANPSHSRVAYSLG
jgi:hypothetical protein